MFGRSKGMPSAPFPMTQSRRTFLGVLGSAAAAGFARPTVGGSWRPAREPSSAKLDRIGIQLYSLRTLATTDLAGVFAALARIGYVEVETAGYYGHTAAEVRELLRQNHLAAPSAHIAIEAIERSPSTTFADAQTIGHQWIVVPSPPGRISSIDEWKSFADRLNAAGMATKSAGFRFAYHNHDTEFRPIDGRVPWDVLMAETDPSTVSAQLDLYHAVNGGADPLDLLSRYGSRVRMLHVKDMAARTRAMVDVGAGTIDFKTIFARASQIEHYFVENDTPADPLAFADHSYKYLSTMEF